jgi:hypothetical protein
VERLYVRSCLLYVFACLADRGMSGRADRLENEHLGNMDQYRITREVPLPYSFDEYNKEMDEGDEDDHPNVQGSRRSSKSKKR